MNKQEVIKMIGKENWKRFEKWITGQTCGLNKDGSADYYAWDVDRFMRGLNVVD